MFQINNDDLFGIARVIIGNPLIARAPVCASLRILVINGIVTFEIYIRGHAHNATVNAVEALECGSEGEEVEEDLL